MDKEEYIVDGFIFSDHEDYANAKDEWNTVEYIKKNSDLTNEIIVYKLFNRLNERKAFKTVIGLKFHRELRDALLKSDKYKVEELNYILVPSNKENQSATTVVSNIINKTDNINYTNLRNARIINIFLVITILAMFLVNIYT
jgi:hypothetical protein